MNVVVRLIIIVKNLLVFDVQYLLFYYIITNDKNNYNIEII